MGLARSSLLRGVYAAIACLCATGCTYIGEYCTTVDRTFTIGTSQAAQILDSRGQATAVGCRAVCTQLFADAIDGGRVDGSTGDGSTAPDAAALDVTNHPLDGCDVVSDDHALAVVCHVRGTCFL